ncbi:MAG TPA: YihY/virulence factor BrkB family protein [Trebonia sp.]
MRRPWNRQAAEEAPTSVTPPPVDSGAAPASPTKLSRGAWLAAGKRTLRKYKQDNLQDMAAALTYYGIQSIFPGILLLVSLLGLIGHSATPLINSLAGAVPGSVHQIVLNAMTHLQHGHAAAWGLAVVGILGGLWATSGYVSAFMRAANVIYDVPEGRPFLKRTALRVGVTAVMVVLLAASAVIVVVTGGLAARVGHLIGIGSAAVTAWNIAKWPVLLIIVSFMVAILDWVSPNARQRFRWVRPGGILAVVLWLIASGLFALYAANFGHYNRVYGSLGGVIVFLVWLWLSNVAILFGAEFNAELERSRAIAGGMPPEQEPFIPLRDTRKVPKQTARNRPS